MRPGFTLKAGLSLLTLSLLGSLGLGAQELEVEEFAAMLDLGEFTVSAAAESPLALAPAGSIVVLEAEDIERSGAATVAEALASASGATILGYGPRGAAANLSLRGASAMQVLVILDGQRLNDARQGAPDLALVPTESIERIEVLSGGASAVYGPDALGGVVVITTKRAEGRRLSVNFENAAYPTALRAGGAGSLADGQRLALEGSLPLGQVGFGFGATAERARNAYPYGGAALRDNAELLAGSARLGLELPLGGGIARASLAGSHQDAGVPGDFIYGLLPESRQRDSSLRGGLAWSSDSLAGGLLKVELRGQGSFSRLDYLDPDYPGLYDTASAGGELRASALLGRSLELGFGGSLSYEATESSLFSGLAGGQPRRLAGGGYLAPTFDLGRLSLAPALRYDLSEDYPAGLSAMLGIVYKASEELGLKLSGGSSYRAPTFNELYWPYMSNPSLEPERGLNLEASLDYRAGALSFGASLFGRFVRDLIQNDETWTPQNIGTALISGSSLKLEYKEAFLRASVSYEFLYPLDLSGASGLADAERIDSISLHQAQGSLALLFPGFDAELATRLWSPRVSGSTALPAALVLELRGRYKLSGGLSLSLAAENLLNAEYELVAGYPMPGLRIVSGVKLEL